MTVFSNDSSLVSVLAGVAQVDNSTTAALAEAVRGL